MTLLNWTAPSALVWIALLSVLGATLLASILGMRRSKPRSAITPNEPQSGADIEESWLKTGLMITAAGGLLFSLALTVIWSHHIEGIFSAISILLLLLIGVLGGSGAATTAFDVAGISPATRKQSPEAGTKTQPAGQHQIPRGGAAIGYLERAALMGTILAGYPEGLVALVAIKGVGRFRELDSPASREQFMIGSMASLIWAAAAAAAARLLLLG